MSYREERWALRNEDGGRDREPDGLLPKMAIFFARWRSRKRDERPRAFLSGRDSPPFAHCHRPPPAAVGAGPVQNLGQDLGSEVDGLVREVEAPPVHGDHRPRAEVEEGAVGLLG